MIKIITLLAATIFSANSFSQAPAIQWERNYGGTKTEAAYCVQQTADGGYIVGGLAYSDDGDVTGNHVSFPDPRCDYWIVKLDNLGNILWEKCFGGYANDVLHSIKPTQDGGYIAAGNTLSNDGDVSGTHDGGDCWIVKLSSTGNLQWQKCLGGTSGDDGVSIQQCQDKGFIVAGNTFSNDGDVSGAHGNGDYWIVKLDSTGNLQWQKCVGGSESDQASSIQQTQDNGYIVAGYTFSNDGDVSGNHGGWDSWIVKLDTSGNIQWQKCLGGTFWDQAYSVRQTMNGGYIVAGYTFSNDGDVSGIHNPAGGTSDYWIVRLDNSGNIQWQKCFGGSEHDIPYSVQTTNDGGYIIAGGTQSNDGDVLGNHDTTGAEPDYWIIKLDSIGNLKWQKCLGGTSNDGALSVQQTFDGGYIIAGQTHSNDGDVDIYYGLGDYWVVKLAPDTVMSVSENNFAISTVYLFPNPATNELTIENSKLKIKKVEIYDAIGKVELNYQLSIINHQLSIDVSQLPSGIYFVTVADQAGNKVTKKVVKL